MCECGCVSNDEKYILPAPKKSLYIITLSGACTNCDVPPGICIERIDKNNILYKEYLRGDFGTKLKLEDWQDSYGKCIITGYTKDKFVKSALKHLIGISSVEMGEDGRIDEFGAEVIAEDMYEDAQVFPQLVNNDN